MVTMTEDQKSETTEENINIQNNNSQEQTTIFPSSEQNQDIFTPEHIYKLADRLIDQIQPILEHYKNRTKVLIFLEINFL